MRTATVILLSSVLTLAVAGCALTAGVSSAEVRSQVVLPRTVVSDVKSFTCGSGSVATLSKDRTRLYVPYLASR